MRRASAGRGIKEPLFIQSYSPSPSFLGNPDLKPERSRGFDAGVEQRFARDRAVVEAIYFSNHFDDLISLGSVYYSFIIRNRRNPSNTQSKWEVGWTGIPEFNNPSLSYFRTALATPSAAADPEGLTFFHRTQFKLYRTTNGAASMRKPETPSSSQKPMIFRISSRTAGCATLRSGWCS